MGQYCNLISEQNIDNSWSWSSVFQLAQWLFLAQECSDSWFIFFQFLVLYATLTKLLTTEDIFEKSVTHTISEKSDTNTTADIQNQNDSTSIAVAVAISAAVVIIVMVVLIVIFVRRRHNKKWENFRHLVGNPEYSVMIISFLRHVYHQYLMQIYCTIDHADRQIVNKLVYKRIFFSSFMIKQRSMDFTYYPMILCSICPAAQLKSALYS